MAYILYSPAMDTVLINKMAYIWYSPDMDTLLING